MTVPLATTARGAHNLRPRGKTLVILGNGPSLAGFDFSRFRGFDAIGMNAAYRYWDKIGWYPRYYICLDAIVGQSHRGEIERLIRERQRNGIELFVLRKDLVDRMPAAIRSDDRVLLFEHLLETSALFSPMPFTTGSHAALVGAMLGYEQMILMGIDGNYVEKIEEAKARSKDVLEIQKTPKSNPNYFFAGYQVEGDQYTVPNPIPNLHVDCWRAVSGVLADWNVTVWNGSKTSRVDFFPYRSFADLESDEDAGASVGDGIETRVPLHFEQAAKAYVDETAVIAKLFADRKGDRHTFLDICANPDDAGAEFRKLGWRVLSLAASDIGAIAKTTGPSAIDVLRISVGGDAPALVKSLPWDRVRPDAIECRFGSSGTEALAIACKDTAEFLVRSGYAVYISEWHRNVRTGARHDWCRLTKSPTWVLASEAWGNILAFKADPGTATLEQTFRACLQFEGSEYMLAKAPIAQSHEPKPAKSASTPVSPDLSKARESLVAVDFKGYLRWSANFARRHPAVLAGFAVLFLALVVAASLPGSQPYRMPLWLVVEALAFGWLLATGMGYAGTLARKVDRRLERQREAVIDALARNQKEVAATTQLGVELIEEIQRTSSKVEALSGRIGELSQAAHDAKAAATHAEDTGKRLLGATSMYNYGRYWTFNRTLSDEHVALLRSVWTRRLSVPAENKPLGYAAHRICMLENLMHGRLATTIEDIMLRAMVAQAVSGKFVSVLEIGTLFGIGAVAVVDALRRDGRDFHLTVIDPLESYYDLLRDISTGQLVSEAIFRDNLRIGGIRDEDVTIIKRMSTSAAAIAEAASREYDLLVIDGDHSYAGVKSDFENYSPFVRQGGFIIFDDYGANDWPEVKQFVDSEMPGHNGFALVGAEWRTSVFRVIGAT